MSELSEIAANVLSWSNDNEDVEVYVSRTVDTEVVAYNGDIESQSRAEQTGIGIRVIRDHRSGFAFAGAIDDEALGETLRDARENAACATPDEFVSLASPDGVAPVEIDAWDEEVLRFPMQDKLRLALELDEKTRVSDPRIRSVQAAEFGDGASEAVLMSTAGINARTRRTGCYVSVYALAGEGDQTQSGGGFSTGRGPSELRVDEAIDDAVMRSTRLLGAVKPKSTRLSVLFDTRATPSIVGALSSALNGENVSKGRSFLGSRMGEQIAVPGFSLVDDPRNPLAYGASSFDGEGLASRKNVLIDGGVLSEWLCDTYAANRLKRRPNGAAVRSGFRSGPRTGARALALLPGHQSQAELIRSIDRGVLVQSLLGAGTGGINAISGDVSLGAEGLLIEDGELTEPVREFTIASTIQEMLMNVSGIGNDIEWLPGAIAGVSIVVDDMALSGN